MIDLSFVQDLRGKIGVRAVSPLLKNELIRWGFPVLCCIVVSGLYLCAIDDRPLWWDEGFSVYAASLSCPDLFEETAADVHPPAYYMFLKGWMAIAGSMPFAVRTLSAFAGILIVPLLYVSGNRLGGRAVGTIAALLGSSAPFFMVYSREARMYGLGMMLAVSSTYACIRILTSSRALLGWWILYVVSTGLGMYTQYVFLLVPVAQGVAVFVSWFRNREGIVPWLIAWTILLALFSPWVIASSTHLHALGNQRLDDVSVREIPVIFQRMATGYAPAEGFANVLVVCGFAFFAFWGAFDLFRRQSVAALPIFLTVIGAILLVAAVSYTPEEGLDRVVRLAFPGVPLLILLVAAGVGSLFRRRCWVGMTALVFLIVAGFSLASLQRLPVRAGEDYGPLIDRVRAVAQPGDAVMMAYVWQDGYFESYAPALSVSFYRLAYDAQNAPSLLHGIFDSHERVWIVNHRADVHNLDDPLNAWLHRHAALATEAWYGNAQLALFVREGDLPGVWSSQARFQDDFTLDYVPLVTSVKPGDTIGVDLRWGIEAAVVDWSYKAFLHLGESDTPPIAQSDRHPADGLERMEGRSPGRFIVERRALLVPLDAMPGSYWLFVGLYDPQSAERLQVVDSVDPIDCDMSDSVCVGRVQIVD